MLAFNELGNNGRLGNQMFQYAGLRGIAEKHGIVVDDLRNFVDGILQRMVFDEEGLTGLTESLDLNWKVRRVKELALMEDLVPVLKKRAAGRDISGLGAYEQ